MSRAESRGGCELKLGLCKEDITASNLSCSSVSVQDGLEFSGGLALLMGSCLSPIPITYFTSTTTDTGRLLCPV